MEAENSRNFKEYSTFGDFERFVSTNIGKLTAEVDHFDEEKANTEQLKFFMRTCSKKLSEINRILKALKDEPELLEEVPEDFLKTSSEKIQKIRRKLMMKKLCPDGIQELSMSKSLQGSQFEEEIENLLHNSTDEEAKSVYNDNGVKKMNYKGQKNSKERLKYIENKYEYINLICNDLNSLATDQKICIESLNKNYSKTLNNAKQGTNQLRKLNEYKQKRSKRNCVIFLIGVLVLIFTFMYFNLMTNANFLL